MRGSARSIAGTFGAFAISVVVGGAAGAQASPSPLTVLVKFREVKGSDTLALFPFDGDVRQIDGRSNMAVIVQPVATASGAPASAIADGITASEDIRVTVDGATQAYRIVRLLLELPPAERNRNTVQWNALAGQAAVAFTALATGANAYIGDLAKAKHPELRERSALFKRRINNVLATGDPDVAIGALAPRPAGVRATQAPDFLEQELAWLTAWLRARSDSVNGSSPRLFLSATLNHKGATTPVSIPGYNDIPVGAQVPFTAINLTPTPAQLAELTSGFEAQTQLASSLNQLVTSKANLRSVLRSTGLDAAAFESALTEVSTAIQALGSPPQLASFASDLSLAAKAATAAAITPRDVQLVADVRTRAAGIIGGVQRNIVVITAIKTLADTLRVSVASARQQTQNDRVQTVVALLRGANGGIEPRAGNALRLGDLREQLSSVGNDIANIALDLDKLASEIRQLAPAARMVADKSIAQRLAASVQPVVASFTALRQELEPVAVAVEALSESKTVAGLIVTTDEPPVSSKPVSFTAAANATIPLTTLTREAGDVVTLQAWTYMRDPNDSTKSTLVETKAQPFEIIAYGWGTSANIGVAYAASQFVPTGQTKESRGFAPQVSWMLGFRPRSGIFAGSNVFGIGLHAATFDLDKDNQMELGIGVTASALSDFLFFGYGIDLTLKSARYWFVGTRLFQLVQGGGTKRAP